MIKFRTYNDIENSYRTKTVNDIVDMGLAAKEVEWCVTEKVHGCLNFDSLIETLEFGMMKIGDIIEKNIKCKVKSYNIDTEEVTFESVIGYSVKEDNGDWYKIVMENGKELYVTGSHYIWLPVEKCWRQVKNLTKNDQLLID